MGLPRNMVRCSSRPCQPLQPQRSQISWGPSPFCTSNLGLHPPVVWGRGLSWGVTAHLAALHRVSLDPALLSPLALRACLSSQLFPCPEDVGSKYQGCHHISSLSNYLGWAGPSERWVSLMEVPTSWQQTTSHWDPHA